MKTDFLEFEVEVGKDVTHLNGVPIPDGKQGLAAALNFIKSGGYEVDHVVPFTFAHNGWLATMSSFLVMAKRVRVPLTEDERVAGITEMNHLIHLLDQRTGPRPGPIDRLYELLDQERNGKPVVQEGPVGGFPTSSA